MGFFRCGILLRFCFKCDLCTFSIFIFIYTLHIIVQIIIGFVKQIFMQLNLNFSPQKVYSKSGSSQLSHKCG